MVQDLYENPSNFFYALSVIPIISSPGDDFTNRYSNEQILADMTAREQSVVLQYSICSFDYYMFHVITPVNFENPLPDRQYKYSGIGFTDNYVSKSITEEAVEEVMTLSNTNLSVPNVAIIPSLLYPEID